MIWTDEFGRVSGPFTESELRQAVGRGSIGATAWVHRNGRWRPIHALLGEVGNHPAWKFLSMLLALSSLIASVVFAAQAELSWGGVSMRPQLFFVGGAIIACALVACLLARYRASSSIFKVVALFSVVAFVMQVASSVQLIRYSSILVAKIGNHQLVRVEPGKIRLTGNIGPDLEKDLRTLLSQQVGAVVVEIDNMGGSIDSAMKAGKYLRSRGNVVTRVTGVCASACLAVFAGGAMQALPGALLDVHAPVNALTNLPLESETVSYKNVLRAAGFGKQLMGAIATTPSSRVTSFSPVLNPTEMPNVVVVDKNGLPLSRSRSIFEYLAGKFAEKSETGIKVGEILAIAGDGFPDIASKSAEQILTAFSLGDEAALTNSVGMLVSTVSQAALPMADAQSIRRIELLTAKAIESAGENYDRCMEVPQEIQIEMLDARLALLNAAKRNNYRAAKRASGASVDRLFEKVLASAAVARLPANELKALSKRANCLIEHAYAIEVTKIEDLQLPGMMAALERSSD